MRERIRSIDVVAVQKAAKYSAVSVIGVLLTQALLVLGHAILDLSAGRANAAAVMVTAIPVFVLNRRWVWGVQGPTSVRREVVPFWAFTVAGLVLSTLAVAATATATDSTVALSLANIAAFGVLWVAKFFVLDGVVFTPLAADVEPDVQTADIAG